MKTAYLHRTVTSQNSIVPAVQLHDQSNYLKVLPGGHCFLCHLDFPNEHNFEKCYAEHPIGPLPCSEACKESKFYTPVFNKWVK